MYQYTTPTITITMPENVDVSDIDGLYIPFFQGKTELFHRELNDVTIDSENNTIIISLTQEETGACSVGTLTFQCHFKIGDVAYATNKLSTSVKDNLHDEEL